MDRSSNVREGPHEFSSCHVFGCVCRLNPPAPESMPRITRVPLTVEEVLQKSLDVRWRYPLVGGER